jgi:capsular polysaccharide export protein
VIHVKDESELPPGAPVIVWGALPLRDWQGPVWRVEDGFLRSVGLGVDLVRPLSWVVDDLGLHYDATRPSRLEQLLEETPFTPELLRRAQHLREVAVAAGLTKYNTGRCVWAPLPTSRVRVLVVGQVEADASLAFGAPSVRRNIDLLKRVRQLRPDAWLIYKPHPDVLAGMRKAGVGEDEAWQLCDEVLGDVPINFAFDHVDEVHVLTSLAGFEALLRQKRVVCHGIPFYAGWGLTEDHLPCVRRSRRLSLDELVAGALLVYPVYFDRAARRCIQAEEALDILLHWRNNTAARPPWWWLVWRMILRKVVGVR